jgi:hypothetical protein
MRCGALSWRCATWARRCALIDPALRVEIEADAYAPEG